MSILLNAMNMLARSLGSTVSTTHPSSVISDTLQMLT